MTRWYMDNLKFFLGIGLAIVLVFFGASVYTQFGGDTTGPVEPGDPLPGLHHRCPDAGCV